MKLLDRVPKWLWWPISSLCLLLPFLEDGLWPLLPTGIALWLLAISQAPTLKQAALGSFVVGLGKYAGGIFWFWETYPIAGAVMLSAWKQWLMIGYFWLGLASSMALGLCFLGVVTVFLVRSNKWLVLWPILFVVSEILSSFFFSIMASGPGSYLNANFSYGYAGLPLSHLSALFPVIAVSGLYGLSLVVAVAGLMLFYILKAEAATSRQLQYKLALGLLGLLLISYLLPSPSIPTLDQTVIAVETRYDKHSYDDPDGLYLKRQGMIEAANAAIQLPADIVLMPEDSRLTENTAAIPDTLKVLLQAAPKTKLVVDTFRSEDLPDQAVLRAVYYDLEHATTTIFDKQYMAPIGEYVMNFESQTLRLAGQSDTLHRLTRNQNYVPGPISRDDTLASYLPGLLFCFENVVPFGVRRLMTDQDSSLVLHPISHGWFNEPRIFWQNTDAMLRVQAIWNNKTIISAGNMSPSKIYYPNGEIKRGKEIQSTKYWSLVEYNL